MPRSNVVTLEQLRHLKFSSLRSKMSWPPLFTTVSMATCVAIYIIGGFGIGLGAADTCLLPTAVFSRLQIYRLFLSPWYHGGFFHILFNMIALYFMGSDFERAVGSLAAAYTTLVVFIPVIGVLHTALAYVLDALAGTSLRNNCAVGISGVIFSLIVVQLKYAETVSFFGLFSLSANVYPFFLLVVLSLLSPGLSFLGHLSGILVGYGLTHAVFTRIIPSDAAFDSLDTKLSLKSLPLHCANPDLGISTSAQNSGLPTSNAPQQRSSLSDAGDVMKAWVAGLSSGGGGGGGSSSGSARQAPAAFSGEGRTLGAPSGGNATSGRIPASSRLLAASDSAASDSATLSPPPAQPSDPAPSGSRNGTEDGV